MQSKSQQSINAHPLPSKEQSFDVRVVAPLNLHQFNKEMVAAHNDYRTAHNAPRIRFNEKLRRFAQEWADHLARIDCVQHRPECPYGENLYACENFEPTGFRTTQRWYQQCCNFNFDCPIFNASTGHFTQLIWAKSRRLGVGVARSDSRTNGGQYYVVANYDPPGNVIGAYVNNVKPPRRQPRELQQSVWQRCCGCACLQHYSRVQLECLHEHNYLRSRHCAPALRLSRWLCVEAQAWAQLLAAENSMRSQGSVRYGENIYSMRVKVDDCGECELCGEVPVQAWYAERKHYGGKYSASTGHYTQVVWATSVELGVGLARSRTGQVYVVAFYYPPGNIQQEFALNVHDKLK